MSEAADPESPEPGRPEAARRPALSRALVAALLGALLAAVLVRFPLLAVPGYEAGVAVGVAAALLGCWLAFELSRARPATPELRWGVLLETPGEAVYAETRAALLGVAPVLVLPLFVLVTQAARTGCRWAPGLWPFLLVALPAAFGGVALGVLFGTLTRRRAGALPLLALFVLLGVATTLAEGLAGPRHVVHDLLLGPISVGAYLGYDRGLSFPPSVYLHRLFSLLAFTAVLAAAAWMRTRLDAPPRDEDEEARLAADDGGWSASRADGPTRCRFLLRHHRRGPRRLLVALGLLALPFLLRPHDCGLLSGRALLQRQMPEVLETEHFRLHHAPGTPVAGHLERLAVEHEHAWRQITAWLELEPDWKVDAWLHPDEDSLFRATGARGYVFAAPWNREYHAVVHDGRVHQLRHELVHVLASEFGGRPFGASWSTGLLEGLATALDEGQARSVEAHRAIAAAHEAGQVPEAERLVSVAGFAAQGPDLSYRASASFVGWLLMEHGAEPFKIAYARGAFERAYGLSAAELGRSWRRFLENRVEAPPSEAARARRRFDPSRQRAFHRESCPRLGSERAFVPAHERARLLSDADRPVDAAQAWCQAFRASADPGHLEAAARERVRAGEFEAALGLVTRTLRSGVLEENRELSLQRRRGLLLAALDRPAEAVEALAAASALMAGSVPAGASDPVLEQLELDRAGLSAPQGPAYARAALRARAAEAPAAELLAERPGWPPALRLLLVATRGEEAARRAERDEAALLFAELAPEAPRLAAGHLREQARAAERATDWERAAALHERILALAGLDAVDRLAAEDGRERCRLAPALGRAARAAQP